MKLSVPGTAIANAAAIVALGVSAGSLLAPQAASALDFNFSFGGVTGLITGLAEGSNPCRPGSGCSVNVIDAGVSGAATGPYVYFENRLPGFTVTGGTIVSFGWEGFEPNGEKYNFKRGGKLLLGGGPESGFKPPVFGELALLPLGVVNSEFGPVTFTSASAPPSAVPGPLPVLGAAAAFGFSRKLRKRIKGSSSTGSTAPFVCSEASRHLHQA